MLLRVRYESSGACRRFIVSMLTRPILSGCNHNYSGAARADKEMLPRLEWVSRCVFDNRKFYGCGRFQNQLQCAT